MFGFIVSILNYYKSYKINNSITSIIDDSSGFHYSSRKKIDDKIKSYGYKINTNINCSEELGGAKLLSLASDDVTFAPNGSSDLGYKGYCVYLVDDSKDPSIPYKYYSYKIVTYMTLDFGIFNITVPYRFTSSTSTLYNCYGLSDTDCKNSVSRKVGN